MNDYVWEVVTRDKYELPVLVANSAEELARLAGVSVSTVCSNVSQAIKRGGTSKYRRVLIDDEEDKDD